MTSTRVRTTFNSPRAGYVDLLDSARACRSVGIDQTPPSQQPGPSSGKPGGDDSDDGNQGNRSSSTQQGSSGIFSPMGAGGGNNDGDDGDDEGGGGDGDGDDDPNEDFHPESSSDDEPELAGVLNKLVKTLKKDKDDSSDTRNKIREPDTFDGSNPLELQSFLFLCMLNFRARPKQFRADSDKVIFAMSYLRGSALEAFETGIVDDDDEPIPGWIDDYKEFVAELKSLFGPHDPINDAQTRISALSMGTNQKISKYIVQFTQLSRQTKWNDASLAYQFY